MPSHFGAFAGIEFFPKQRLKPYGGCLVTSGGEIMQLGLAELEIPYRDFCANTVQLLNFLMRGDGELFLRTDGVFQRR
jgi:hypothetical protein